MRKYGLLPRGEKEKSGAIGEIPMEAANGHLND